MSIVPTVVHSNSPRHSILLRHDGADPSTDHEASFYYNLPVAVTRDEPIVGMSGWGSFGTRGDATFDGRVDLQDFSLFKRELFEGDAAS